MTNIFEKLSCKLKTLPLKEPIIHLAKNKTKKYVYLQAISRRDKKKKKLIDSDMPMIFP